MPWCFACDKVNYARYLSAYFAEMTNLPVKNPDVYEAFTAGNCLCKFLTVTPLDGYL